MKNGLIGTIAGASAVNQAFKSNGNKTEYTSEYVFQEADAIERDLRDLKAKFKKLPLTIRYVQARVAA